MITSLDFASAKRRVNRFACRTSSAEGTCGILSWSGLAVVFAAVAFLFSTTSLGQELVINGDFESDTFTVAPGYTGGGNPEEISGWIGMGNRGINPVFPIQNPLSVEGWDPGPDSVGGFGLNPVNDPDHANPSPFADNGDVDGIVLFLQGQTSIRQEVTGLTPGTDYLLTVDYNARNCCGDVPAVALELNGVFSPDFPNPFFQFDDIVDPVQTGPWYDVEIPLTANSETLLIEFFSEPFSGGDATFLLDNISLTPAAGGDELIVNGTFDANANQWVSWPGYRGTEGTGVSAPFRDNGNNQTQVALLQNVAWIEQEVSGLIAGEEYELSLEYNARDCCQDDAPLPSLLLDGEFLADFPSDFPVVLPVLDDNDWYAYETTFTAEGESVVLRIENESDLGLDSTLLVDNVSIMRVGGEPGLPGDFNGNGGVEQGDLDLVLLNWGDNTPPIPSGWINDLPGGAIDQGELDKVLLNWGNTAAVAGLAIPEPRSCITLLIATVFAGAIFARSHSRHTVNVA